jgi:hypothetical protein
VYFIASSSLFLAGLKGMRQLAFKLRRNQSPVAQGTGLHGKEEENIVERADLWSR